MIAITDNYGATVESTATVGLLAHWKTVDISAPVGPLATCETLVISAPVGPIDPYSKTESMLTLAQSSKISGSFKHQDSVKIQNCLFVLAIN